MALVERLLLGVDVGTSAVKGVLATPSGQIVAEAEVGHSVSMPRPGWAEHDAERTWWQGFVAVVRRLTEAAGCRGEGTCPIAAVGLSALCPAMALVDENGELLRAAILYGIDTRAHREIDELQPVIGAGTLQASGAPLTTHSFLPKLLWLERHEPEVYRRTHRVMTANGYLAWRLTGRHVMDRKSACSAGLLDLSGYGLAVELARAAGIRHDWFGDLAWPTEVVGRVSSRAASATGLAAGTPVVIGTCDIVAEAVGAGLSRPGDLLAVFGSTLGFLLLTPDVVRDPALLASVYVQPGSFYVGGATGAAGTLTRWFVEQMTARGLLEARAEADSRLTADGELFSRLEAQAGRIAAGSDGLLVVPYWRGARTPRNDPRAGGIVAGLRTEHTAAHVYRALLEGVGYEFRDCMEHLEEIGLEVAHVACAGGGVRNRLWMQIVADILGRRLDCHPGSRAPLGAARMAGAGVGMLVLEGLAGSRERAAGGSGAGDRTWPAPADAGTYAVDPVHRNVDRYARLYPLWQELAATARGVSRRLYELAEPDPQ